MASVKPAPLRPTSGIVDTRRILRSLGFAAPPSLVVRAVERALGVTAFERLCARARVPVANADVRKQISRLFAAAGVRWEATDAAPSSKLIRSGPVIFYANHPYGLADALIALSIALELRSDTKVLANSVLAAFDFPEAHTIWVDVGSGAGRLSTNRRSLRSALDHLRSGGALLIFPSGMCSHLELPACRVTDPPWSPHLLSLIDRTKATCVPLYFHGRNSWRFQALGVIHPLLRTLLLLREFVALRNRCVRVSIGAPVHWDGAGGERAHRMQALRERVYALRLA
jgi:putative hemolysin